MKEIQIIRGEEFKVQVRNEINEKDIFIDEYEKAAYLLEEILYASSKQLESKKENGNPFSVNNHTEYNNNIIAFCGERGDGKTSAMMTFMNVVKQYAEQKNSSRKLWQGKEYVLFKNDSIVRKTNFIDTIHVDPSALDDVHNVLDIVVANMFRHFKREYERGGRHNFTVAQEKLVKCFQNVYRALSLKKDSEKTLREEFDDEGSIAKLSKLSDSMRLKEYMFDLLYAYFEYMTSSQYDEDITKCAILISIDDLDVNISSAYAMSEEIRKYLVLPGIVIIMALRTRQLQLSVEEYNIVQLEQHFKEKDTPQMRQEMQEMAERYVSKLIPLAHQVYLPKIQDVQDIEVIYKDSEENEKHIKTNSIVDFIFDKIYIKTGMLFRPYSQGHSYILPNNTREIISCIVLLDEMKDPIEEKDEVNRDAIKHANILKLLNSYYREWVNTLSARDDNEVFIRQEIQKLIDFNVDMRLHIGINEILDMIHEMYGEKRGPATAKASDQYRNDTNYGINSMCCVMNLIRNYENNYYRLEVKKVCAAIAFLYTLKLNLLLTKNRYKKNEELGRFIQDTVMGYDIVPVISGTYYQNQIIYRGRFYMPTVLIFNTIAKYLQIRDVYFLHSEDVPRVTKNMVPIESEERKRYILSWVIFALFANKYFFVNVNTAGAKPQIRLLESFIYDNFQLNPYQQISVENYLVRLGMLDRIYDILNLRIVGVTEEEFLEVIALLKSQNKISINLSHRFISNIDLIQGLPIICAKQYNGDAKGEQRDKKIVEKFFYDAEQFLKSASVFSDEKEKIDEICTLAFLQYEENRWNIAELYSLLFQESLGRVTNVSNDTNIIYHNQMQEFRDILELRANDKILQTAYDAFANFVTTSTKLIRVQGHLLNMARDIGKYMLLSGNREYLSNEWKERLCSLYEKVLNGQQINEEAIVTEQIRQEYKNAARNFNPKNLSEAITSLLNKGNM
ncbi:hypothetical protein [Selenomonas ruminantium]|uniref:Uncharacterized protein n=1 Tax=Selenomonas ruminantium TaxID=971 RepID=A0A1I0XD18_SELRU|nr:hypothetical protein [Selenomonas ruminantium]SFA98774.1 hypothetical protein SAMN05216587_105107 [Selenomonas ruminantium]